MTAGPTSRSLLTARLLAAADSLQPDAAPDALCAALAAAVPPGPDRLAWIEELVDDGRAAWDLLLGGAARGHLLLGGAGWSAATLALTRRWERVTVVDPDPSALALLERRCDAEGIANLATLRLEAGPALPVPDAACDAVAWIFDDDAAPPLPGGRRGGWERRFLAECVRVLRPGGGLYLATPGPWSRERLRARTALLRPGAPAALGPRAFAAAAAACGLTVARRWALEGRIDGPRSWIDLDDPDAVAEHRRFARDAARRLPPRLYGITAPRYALTATRGPAGASWFEEALQLAARELGLAEGRWRAAPPLALRKGKLVTTLRADDGRAWIAKAPLRDDVAAAMRHGQRALDALLSRLAPQAPLRGLLPARALDVEHRGRRLHLESYCCGRPWAADRDGPSPAAAGLAGVLRELLAVDPAACGLDDGHDALPRAVADLAALLQRHDPALAPTLRAAAAHLDAGRSPRLHLRKGDLSLSNVFLEEGRIRGLIDWDETGATRQPLAPLGDLLFSWLWHRAGWSRARSLVALAGGRTDDLPPSLGVARLLAELGRDPDDLARGALASWLEHAYHELQHPVFRYREDRVAALLVEPCRALAAAGLAGA